jgi:isoleucyl-tRNA synthetase
VEAGDRAAAWDALLPVREQVLKSLETARQEKFIGAPLEARVHLEANGDLYPLLRAHEADLPALFIVSQVSLSNGSPGPLRVRIERADGEKCERCWKYRTDIGEDAEFPTICSDCAEAVNASLQAHE